MNPENLSDDLAPGPDRDSQVDWTKGSKRTPLSIVVSPYLRFLRGILVLRKARDLLQTVRLVAVEGLDSRLAEVFWSLEQSDDAKQLGLTYETFFASHLTVNLVSEVENFLGSAVSAVLRIYPQKMGACAFKLVEIISAGSTDELIDRAAKAVLNEMMYAKPVDYIRRLASILSIDVAPLEESWSAFVELKARRDLGIHNSWITNEIYFRKIRESNISTSHKLEDRLTPDFVYMDVAMNTCQGLVDKMADLLAEKWLPWPTTDVC